MPPADHPSEFRVEKRRVEASLVLTNGETVHGCFFVAGSGPGHEGPERVGELLNAGEGFFPFERAGAGTALYNRPHVVVVSMTEPEARHVPGYEVATARTVSLELSDGRRVVGSVRVYRPEGRDRLSDWARDPVAFRYVETGEATLLVNVAHIVDAREVDQ